MKEVTIRLVNNIKRTESVQSFRFVPDEKINFMPGQFLQIIFDENNKNNRSLNKYLSFSCAPGKEYIEVTKRISESQFSQKLRELKQGDTILCKAPMGNCVYKDEYKKIGFLIGGIGITPVISIIEYIVEKKLQTDICLLYSNRFVHDIAFKPELDTWQSIQSNMKIFYTVTDCVPNDKNCLIGVINKEMIFQTMPDWQERVIFAFGTPAMVNAMKNICTEISCVQSMIKTETFIGY